MAAKSPPPTRAAIEIDGPTEARRTSSERRPTISRCATCWSTEFARARPSRLLTSTRCSISNSATATWLVSEAPTSALLQRLLEPLAVRQAGERVEVVRATPSPAALPPAPCADPPLPSASGRSSHSVSARRTRPSARSEATRQSNGRSSEVGDARLEGRPTSRRLEQRARIGTARPVLAVQGLAPGLRPPSSRRAMSARTTSRAAPLEHAGGRSPRRRPTTTSKPALASQRLASLRLGGVEADQQQHAASSDGSRSRPGSDSMTLTTGSACSAT